jgi:hypothetical protein
MSNDKLQIRLGPSWSIFAYPRDAMNFLGTVQRGMQIGALASLADGGYAQVNGDIVEPLNKSRIEHALRAATGTRRGEPLVNVRRPSTAVVTVKKKRRIVPPGPG